MDIFKNPLFLLGILGTTIFFLVFITRHIVEAAKPKWKKQADANDKKKSYLSTGARWWNEVILYGLGPFYGVILLLGLRDYLPEEFKASTLIIVISGTALGFTCGYFFKIAKKILTKAAGMKDGELDETIDVPDVPGGE